MIESFDLFAPEDVNEQRAIAAVLGSLDDKIELNRRMNRTLEALARAIFKAWFVDFEPVKAKAAGATSFSGMPQPVFD
jgi:type I restriction enzyme S subunit